MADVAVAQRLALDVAAGRVYFPDNAVVGETLVAGAARYYLMPRLAVGPELSGVVGDGHSHLILTGNLTFDMRGATAGRSVRVTPFLVAGGGVYQTRERFRTGPYTSSEGAFTLGGGVRVRAGDRGHVGVEARMGWEAHIRVNAVVGWRFGP